MTSNLHSRNTQPNQHPPAKIVLRVKLPLVWLLLLFILAFLLPERIWNTLLIGIGGMFLAAYGWVRALAKGLFATRRLRFGWVSVGDRLEEEFLLINKSSIPALWVEIVDSANVPGYRTAVVRSVANMNTSRWRESAICMQRGRYQLGPWTIRSSDPFGLFIVSREYLSSSEVIIHPPIHTGIPIPLPTGQRDGRVRTPKRAWRATINAATVRDYQPSDPFRWIHWRTSARRDELFVREFDLDAAGDIWIVLDLDTTVQLGEGLDGTEEHAVLLAASLAARALQQNRPVGVAGYGQTPQIVPPGRGIGQRWQILRALALVNADGQSTLTQVIADMRRQVRQGTAVIIITPRIDPEWLPDMLTLHQRGVQNNIILLDRPSFGGSGNSETMRQAIHRMGVSCHVIHQGETGDAQLEGHRRGHWAFIVTGTGHVVAVEKPQRLDSVEV
jgi:uncharacterized protein (DUF58 family)